LGETEEEERRET